MLDIDNVHASRHVSEREAITLHAVTLHAPSGDARKTSLALLISVALHALLLFLIATLTVVGPAHETSEPFALYLGPIGAAGGIGGSRGSGAPAAAASGETAEKLDAQIARKPEPIPVPTADAVAVPKPNPPPVAKPPQPKLAAATPSPPLPSSGQGASSGSASAVGEPNGVPGGQGAGGAGAGGTASYEQALAAWLDSHKYYPSTLRRRGIEGEGKLRIEITRAGRLVGVEVARAFSHPSLESIAEDWVKRSEPFPPMPASIPGESYTFVVPVVFRLE